METPKRYVGTPVVFIADDQPDDQYLYRQAFSEACPTAVLYFFVDKAELLAALRGDVYPRPSLLIMDWNMISCKGYAALAELAQTPDWRTISVAILASSDRPVDEDRCQQFGCELILPKETQHEKLVGQLAGLIQAFA
ncbi:response regulator [Spirosoma taeanense]|uniref:Response regulator n=1 Tax=Spirosoma taeanense TaxID=2735870 RepID=A0A6M5Y8B6_9BACT|nr:response regulator [Spirosoma taeanense]QJW89500.1 response regulator [Spirosoma taeanense]